VAQHELTETERFALPVEIPHHS